MAYMLIAESRLYFDPNAMAYFQHALNSIETISEDQRYLLENTNTWPIQAAI